MKRLAVVVAIAGALAAPAAASAGGMAAWALSGPQPGIRAGDVWVAKLRVVACMGTPADMVPTLVVTENATGREFRVRARSTGAVGKYTASVRFPSAGNWSYRVDLLNFRNQTFGPYRVGPAQVAQPDRLLAALPPVGAALLVLGTGLALRRRRA
jgi:hypothetical protein